MDINKYDHNGRTQLMNAAIGGDYDRVKSLLDLGADPTISDENWGTTTAQNFAGRKSKNSEVHKRIEELLIKANPYSSKQEEHIELSPSKSEDSGIAKSQTMDKDGITRTRNKWPYETIQMVTGAYVTRLRSSIFYWGALTSLFLGFTLLSNGMIIGGFLILTVSPCLVLYPLIRFLFGGKDSIGVVVTTAVAEELLKSELRKSIDRSKKKR